MKKLERLLAINQLSKKDSKWIHKDLFRLLYKDDIWIAADRNLKRKKKDFRRRFGIRSETEDAISGNLLQELKQEVCSEEYPLKSVKLLSISKSNEKSEFPNRARTKDQILQEVLRMILESIYEPVFVLQSFGFRTHLGCHDALYHVETTFPGVDYVIQVDRQDADPRMDHHRLIAFLKKRIHDARFLRLVWKVLGCGILEEDSMQWSKSGILEESILSPILVNIYYHEFDEFVHHLRNKYQTLKNALQNRKGFFHSVLEYQISKMDQRINFYPPQSSERKKLTKDLNVLRKERLKWEGFQEEELQIEYVRYGKDWKIGVAGDKSWTKVIQEEISLFLSPNRNPLKMKIVNLRKGNLPFLGYFIFLPQSRFSSGAKEKGPLRFDIPLNALVKRYTDQGYFQKLEKGVRPISHASSVNLQDHVIVMHFQTLWLGLFNYYSGCTNRGHLQYLHSLLYMSCAMTLGHKHRLSSSKIFQKYGKELEILLPNKKKRVGFSSQTDLRLEKGKWFLGRKITFPPYCDSDLVV